MYQRSLRLFTIWMTLSVVLILLISFGTHKIAVAQQLPDKIGSTNYNSSAITDRLDKIINLLNQSRHGSLIALYLTIIAFLMGLAFVIFGLYIGQEHKLTTFTEIIPKCILCTYCSCHSNSNSIYSQRYAIRRT